MKWVWSIVMAAAVLAACENQEDTSPGARTEPAGETAASLADSSQTAARYAELMEFARANALHERPIGEILQELGEQFLGRPYITWPLDGFGKEVLVARLDSFDCFTYLEAMLAAARGVVAQDYSYTSYLDRTEEQRYRDGRMGDYCSRLHYYTEWIQDNEEKGIVEHLTDDVGGVRLDKTIDFMSEHRESYPILVDNDSLYQCIKDVEDRLNRTYRYSYIPQDSIRMFYDQLRPGDLIATSTHIEGLDVTHTGMVYRGEDGSTGLLHASTDGGVKISPDLQEYVQGVKAQTGIIVARAIEKGKR